MSVHINRFLDLVKAAESRQQRTVCLTLVEAKNLHCDITRLLLRVQSVAEHKKDNQTVTVVMDGGKF